MIDYKTYLVKKKYPHISVNAPPTMLVTIYSCDSYLMDFGTSILRIGHRMTVAVLSTSFNEYPTSSITVPLIESIEGG